MTPVINSNVEVANRAVYWIAEGIKRKDRGHRMIITDNPKTLMFGWMDVTKRKEMRLRLIDLKAQRKEIEQVFSQYIYRQLLHINGRKEIFGA